MSNSKTLVLVLAGTALVATPAQACGLYKALISKAGSSADRAPSSASGVPTASVPRGGLTRGTGINTDRRGKSIAGGPSRANLAASVNTVVGVGTSRSVGRHGKKANASVGLAGTVTGAARVAGSIGSVGKGIGLAGASSVNASTSKAISLNVGGRGHGRPPLHTTGNGKPITGKALGHGNNHLFAGQVTNVANDSALNRTDKTGRPLVNVSALNRAGGKAGEAVNVSVANKSGTRGRSTVNLAVLNGSGGTSGKVANVSVLNKTGTTGRSLANVAVLNGSGGTAGKIANVSVLNKTPTTGKSLANIALLNGDGSVGGHGKGKRGGSTGGGSGTSGGPGSGSGTGAGGGQAGSGNGGTVAPPTPPSPPTGKASPGSYPFEDRINRDKN